MAAGDLARLTTLVTTARVEELGEPNALETFKLATAMYPEGASITGVRVTGDDATLQLTGKTQAGSAEGTVQLRRELGAWKVSTEDWRIEMRMAFENTPSAEPQLPPGAVRPGDYSTLLGTWQGGSHGTRDWTFTFAEGYAVTGTHASGAYYRGQAAIFWDLGASSRGLRVPPGWSVLDVHVADASEARHAGQVSLGTFSKQDDTLKFCGSEPGTLMRTESFEAPPQGVRCLTMKRAGSQ
jgi:hypothetical protein